ncbi:hypothetical protein LguiB_013579 [Lonicera macranthoides]
MPKSKISKFQLLISLASQNSHSQSHISILSSSHDTTSDPPPPPPPPPSQNPQSHCRLSLSGLYPLLKVDLVLLLFLSSLTHVRYLTTTTGPPSPPADPPPPPTCGWIVSAILIFDLCFPEEQRAEHPLREEGTDETTITLPLASQVSVIEGEIGVTRGTTVSGLGRSSLKLPKGRGGVRASTSESILAKQLKSQDEQLKAANERIRQLEGQYTDIHEMVRQLKETHEAATGLNTSQR